MSQGDVKLINENVLLVFPKKNNHANYENHICFGSKAETFVKSR